VNGAMLAIALTVTLTTPSPVGTLLLPANGKSATALCRDHKLRVFSLPDGKLLRTIDGTSAPLALSTISDDGRWVMLSDYRGDVSIVDTATGESQFKQHVDHYLTAAAFSHDGRLLAAAPGAAAVRIIDVAAKRVINELERAAFIGAIAFSRDNKCIATADGYGVSVFEIGGKRISRNDDFLLSPLALDFSADGKNFAVATMNADNLQLPSPVVFSDIASPQKKSQWMPPKDVVGGGWTADGHFIAAIATKGAVRLQSVR
jgi:WD40 repeat protein